MYLFPKLDINKTCCFTGPRPEKITDDIELIKKYLKAMILESVADGYTHFITGMSRGIDIYAAKIVLELENDFNIKLLCAVPFMDQAKNWPLEDKNDYEEILKKARYTICLSEEYISTIYYSRNRMMVDHSSRVITFYKNSGGGTKYTLDYANSKNRKVINVAEKLELTLYT